MYVQHNTLQTQRAFCVGNVQLICFVDIATFKLRASHCVFTQTCTFSCECVCRICGEDIYSKWTTQRAQSLYNIHSLYFQTLISLTEGRSVLLYLLRGYRTYSCYEILCTCMLQDKQTWASTLQTGSLSLSRNNAWKQSNSGVLKSVILQKCRLLF